MDAVEEEMTQEDCWQVISAFFAEKGLVRQQLDSFDEFVQNTMQELVDEYAELTLQANAQHTGLEGDVTVSNLPAIVQTEHVGSADTRLLLGRFTYRSPCSLKRMARRRFLFRKKRVYAI